MFPTREQYSIRERLDRLKWLTCYHIWISSLEVIDKWELDLVLLAKAVYFKGHSWIINAHVLDRSEITHVRLIQPFFQQILNIV